MHLLRKSFFGLKKYCKLSKRYNHVFQLYQTKLKFRVFLKISWKYYYHLKIRFMVSMALKQWSIQILRKEFARWKSVSVYRKKKKTNFEYLINDFNYYADKILVDNNHNHRQKMIDVLKKINSFNSPFY